MSVFNAGPHFSEAVESILCQSFSDFEFLIIDDGSLEPISNIVAQWRDSRIVVLRHENCGLTKSLNRGLRLCQGEYVARMDADDVSLPERLARQVSELDAHPHLDLVGSSFEVIDEGGKLIDIKSLIQDPLYRLWRLLFHNNYGHGTVMLRKGSALQVGGYDESFLYAQDYDLWSRLSSKINTSMLPEPLYRYRMTAGSNQASVKHYDAQLTSAIRISNRNLMRVNPALDETSCAEIRALYWKFQKDFFDPEALYLLADTFDGFCIHYALTSPERRHLGTLVLQDVMNEVSSSSLGRPDQPSRIVSRFVTRMTA